ncbi:glycosyltransferase [Vibrio maerlii]|uniref:glycosyltransferase n=1 Tax=Vibrio maerlii TaxID=2231648 RepID=UPI000E3C8945|nr:glycosyltransferase [Vibrio maerlii]
MNKQRVIHVVQHLSPGGLESLVLDIVQFSQSNTLIVSLEGTKDEALAKWPKLNQYKNKLSFLNKQPGVQLPLLVTLHKVFKTLQPDVVHTHHIGPLLYAGFAAKTAGVAHCIHTEHDAWHLHSLKRRALESAALKLVRPHLVADAKQVGREVQRFFPSQNVKTILNGIDTQRFVEGHKSDARACFGLPQHATIIGSAGRLEHVKGHDVLISALMLLPKTTHLAIAGDGSQFLTLRKQVDKLNLSERVHFVGRVDQVERFYQALDIFCLPSRNEGYPLTALEAQACGIPTAVTNVGSSHETLCPHTGMLIKANNIPDMAICLQRMMTQIQQNTPSPRTFVCAHNDIRDMVTTYEQLVCSQPAIFA